MLIHIILTLIIAGGLYAVTDHLYQYIRLNQRPKVWRLYKEHRYLDMFNAIGVLILLLLGLLTLIIIIFVVVLILLI